MNHQKIETLHKKLKQYFLIILISNILYILCLVSMITCGALLIQNPNSDKEIIYFSFIFAPLIILFTNTWIRTRHISRKITDLHLSIINSQWNDKTLENDKHNLTRKSISAYLGNNQHLAAPPSFYKMNNFLKTAKETI
ncbi:MAG: hypothetical protein ACRC4L_00325 [Mycoplasma sp.]